MMYYADVPEQSWCTMDNNITHHVSSAISLLQQLIATPSFSGSENDTAELIAAYLVTSGVQVRRHNNNVWAVNKNYNPAKPTLLLNSHHDTVQPNSQYTINPFEPTIADGKLFGLGSNDAGAPLVALIETFLHFYPANNLRYNLVIAATAEEEISGKHGVESILPLIGPIDCAIVGEPTQMQMAVAERGLMVLDCIATGRAGHAARNEGINAISLAVRDIQWFHSYAFSKVSDLLGPVRMTATIINTPNTTHNIIPDTCNYVVDIRANELHSFEEILTTIRSSVHSTISPRSTRLRSTIISADHPLVCAGQAIGRTAYGSPTTSDKALLPCPALKIGPGDSARSHTANEYVFTDEIASGIEMYIRLLEQLL